MVFELRSNVKFCSVGGTMFEMNELTFRPELLGTGALLFPLMSCMVRLVITMKVLASDVARPEICSNALVLFSVRRM